MSFLSGLGRGLQRAFDGTNLAITQAILAGDYQGAAALRARQDELQRQLQQDRDQHDARNRQVIGAKNLGIGLDAISAMSPQDLSAAIRQGDAMRMFRPSAGVGGGEGDSGGQAVSIGGAAPAYALPPGAPPPAVPLAPASLRAPQPAGLFGGSTPGVAAVGGATTSPSPNALFDPGQSQPGPFDPSYFSTAPFIGGGLLDRAPIQPPYSSAHGAPAVDPNAAVQQAAAAIRVGADPKAVRARLNQMRLADSDVDPRDAFSDLAPRDRQAFLDIGAPAQQLPAANAIGKSTPVRKSLLTAAEIPPDEIPEDPFTDMMAADERALNSAVHAAPLPNDHPFPNPSHVDDEDIMVTGPRRAAREAMRQAYQHSAELQRLGRVIAIGEGNYESYNTGTRGMPGGRVGHSFTTPPPGTVTSRTINEILSTYSLPPTDPRRMFVVGRYQVSHDNLLGALSEMHLTGNERLTPELQDRIFAEYLVPHAFNGDLGRFIFQGRGTVDDAQYAAARQWASIAVPRGRRTATGRMSDGTMTYYDRGSANAANRSATDALTTYLMNLHR